MTIDFIQRWLRATFRSSITSFLLAALMGALVGIVYWAIITKLSAPKSELKAATTSEPIEEISVAFIYQNKQLQIHNLGKLDFYLWGTKLGDGPILMEELPRVVSPEPFHYYLLGFEDLALKQIPDGKEARTLFQAFVKDKQASEFTLRCLIWATRSKNELTVHTQNLGNVPGWPQPEKGQNNSPSRSVTDGLVIAYDGGRYDHKETRDGQIIFRIIRLQLENKSRQTINGIKVKAESFDNLGTRIPQVPLRICHDEHNSKKDGFSLTPGEKELIDVVDKGIGWDVVRLCHPLSLSMATRETNFKMTVVMTAENQPKQQTRLRIAVDKEKVLRCDALRT
jgi:hypothetical protein